MIASSTWFESDEDAIHIPTIHSANGLEYPIVFLGGLGSHRGGRVGSIEGIANRQTLQLACRAGSGWQTSNYEDAVRREKQMADAEAVRLLYVAPPARGTTWCSACSAE